MTKKEESRVGTDRPVFIIGSGRSGTTLLRLLIDTSDEVAIGPESDIVWATLSGIPEALWNRVKCAKAVVRRASFASRELAAFGYTPDEFDALIQRSPSRKAFLDSFFNAYRQRKGKARWGDKTPMNLIAIPELLACYPDAQFIHIYRNPKAVAHSFVKQSFGPDNLGDAARMWYFRTRFILEQDLPASKLFSLSYEALLTKPREILDSLFTFMGVDTDADDIVKTFHVARHDGVYAEEMQSPLDPSRIDHHDVSQEDERLVESICADLMQMLDYPCRYVQTLSEQAQAEREAAYAQWLHEWLQAMPAAQIAALLDDRKAVEPRDGGVDMTMDIATQLNREGEEKYLAGDVQGAERLFSRAFAMNAACLDACNNLAVVFWQQGDQDKALEQIRRGMEVGNVHRDLFVNQVAMSRATGNNHAAEEACKAYLAANPEDSEFTGWLNELAALQETPPTESDFEHSLADPTTPLAACFDDDSDKLLVAFGGIGGAMGILPFEFFGVMRNIASSKLFVRDLHQSWYHEGLNSMTDNLQKTAEVLATMIQRSGARRIVFVGNSMGGYAALLFGALLGVDEVHAFSPQTFIDDVNRSTHNDERWAEQIAHTQRVGDPRYFDLYSVLASERKKTRFHLYSCSSSETDWVHAQHLVDLDQVTIHAYPEGGHDLVRQLRDAGQLQLLLSAALEGIDRGAGRVMSQGK